MTLLGAVAASRRRAGGAVHGVPLLTETVDGTGNYATVQPGDTLLLESGVRGRLVLTGLVGTPAAPITVVDDGGLVDIVGGGVGEFAALDIRGGCKHIRVVGSDTQVGAAFTAGQQQARIKCSNSDRGVAPRIGENVEFVELAYIEVADTTGNPGVHTGEGDRVTIPVARSFWVHHCYIHDIVDAEGIYIGDSAWNVGAGSELDGVVVEYNLVEDIEHDGMQFGAARYNSNIPGGYSRQMFRGNVIRRTGLVSPQAAHDRGISSQRGNWQVDIVGNIVVDAGGHGINDQAVGGGYLIANNLIVRWARTDAAMDGINIGQGDGVGSQLDDIHIVHNTVVDGPNWGVEPNRDGGAGCTIRNNIVVGAANTGQIEANPGDWTETDNLKDALVSAAGFVNAAGDDYHLDVGSAALDAGTDLSALPWVDVDVEGVARPQGAGWDQGCYERVAAEFFVADVLADPGLFGVTPTGRPYHDTVAVDVGDEATIDVDAAGVFLEA